jgi:hypothetical protein
MSDSAPAPLLGCLICHAENTLTLTESRQLLPGGKYPLLVCSKCESTARFDANPDNPDDWRIRYNKISSDILYNFARYSFKRRGWLHSEEALSLSTDVYIQRQRLNQVTEGDLSWLKPGRLSPPPPLMSAREVVYLALKPVTYYETGKTRIPGMGRRDVELDTGTLYATGTKLHLLGQRRDRSHRLTEVRDVQYRGGMWTIHTVAGEQPHHYQGLANSGSLDAELIAAVIDLLVYNAHEKEAK